MSPERTVTLWMKTFACSAPVWRVVALLSLRHEPDIFLWILWQVQVINAEAINDKRNCACFVNFHSCSLSLSNLKCCSFVLLGWSCCIWVGTWSQLFPLKWLTCPTSATWSSVTTAFKASPLSSPGNGRHMPSKCNHHLNVSSTSLADRAFLLHSWILFLCLVPGCTRCDH